MPTSINTYITFKLCSQPYQLTQSTVKKFKASFNANQELFEFINNKNTIESYTDGSKIKNVKFIGSACTYRKLNLTLKNSIDCKVSVYMDRTP